jgi:hypothetical protein
MSSRSITDAGRDRDRKLARLRREFLSTIGVDSQIGKFSEFTVRLPRTFGATIAEAAS